MSKRKNLGQHIGKHGGGLTPEQLDQQMYANDGRNAYTDSIEALLEGLPDGSRDVVADDQGRIHIGKFILTAIGLNTSDEITADDWIAFGSWLRMIGNGIQWAIGDWANIGYASVQNWIEGEETQESKYSLLLEQTDYAYQTLRDYAYVAANIAMSIRIDTVPFSQHRLVAAMNETDQRYWLSRAALERWSVSRMREEIKQVLIPPTTSSSEKWLFSKDRKPRVSTQMEKLWMKARAGDEKARQQALGMVAEHRKWLDEFEAGLDD